METGPEHYEAAERLLNEARSIPSQYDETNPATALIFAEAQVHATLALAAATALGSFRADEHGMPASDGNLWITVCSGDADFVEMAESIEAEKVSRS